MHSIEPHFTFDQCLSEHTVPTEIQRECAMSAQPESWDSDPFFLLLFTGYPELRAIPCGFVLPGLSFARDTGFGVRFR